MKPILELKNASKSYLHEGRSIEALKKIDCKVAKGEIFGIIGLSGAGKSTLIRALAGLVPLTSGELLFEGNSLALMDEATRHDFLLQLGMIFQHFNLLSSRTVAGNISYPLEIAGIAADERKKRVEELLSLVGLTGMGELYTSRLSGGQKQRVGIARALACHPKLLLCDEATSALDPKTTQEILELLATINRSLGVTIVLITHEMEVVRHLCDRVAVIDAGEIVEEGAVSQIFANPSHKATKGLLQRLGHQLPDSILKSSRGRLLRLYFQGQETKEPIITGLVRHFGVDVNILMGWIDQVGSLTIGMLVIELEGPSEKISSALDYLQQHHVKVEEIDRLAQLETL